MLASTPTFKNQWCSKQQSEEFSSSVVYRSMHVLFKFNSTLLSMRRERKLRAVSFATTKDDQDSKVS